MSIFAMLFLFLLLIAGSLTAFACLIHSVPPAENKLSPFVMLPVPDASPSTKAFLEFYASQVAWMDSSVLQCIFLIWQDSETKDLCEDMSHQHDFFCPLSLPDAQEILKKNCRTCCNSSENVV